MKVLANLTYYDYDYAGIAEEAFLVPDDFDQKAEYQKWAEETLVPTTGRNQHGEWKSKKYKQRTINFVEWLRKKYETVKIEECEMW